MIIMIPSSPWLLSPNGRVWRVHCREWVKPSDANICKRVWIEFLFMWFFTLLKRIFHSSKQGSVDEFEIRILLHQSLAGCVIGKGGSKIKELKDVSRNFFNYC